MTMHAAQNTRTFPMLPGTPLQQADELAQWASAHNNLAISEAGLDLWDAIFNQSGWFEDPPEMCMEAAGNFSLWGQSQFAFGCSRWADRVTAALNQLAEVLAIESSLGEIGSSAAEGAITQAQQAEQNWAQFVDETSSDLAVAGAGASTVLLAVAGLYLLTVLK